MKNNCPIVLTILDGWGYSENQKDNAIWSAKKPNFDQWWTHYPHMLIEASGLSVGLPPEQMGNSEVGHMHIGAGRVIYQDFTRINQSIEDGTYEKLPLFIENIEKIKKNKTKLHLFGLFSEGGVHAHQTHLFHFLKICHAHALNDVYLHLFLDGRDTPPKSAVHSFEKLDAFLKQFPGAQIASITGRYYAMDRDKRWDRTLSTYHLLVEGDTPHHFNTAQEAIASYYSQNITDEFIPPTRLLNFRPIETNDGIFFFNFRADRARQLTQCFIEPQDVPELQPAPPPLSFFMSMTQYSKALNTQVAFPPLALKNTIGEVLALNHFKQLRIAETEKYAHVTFFFNGGVEPPFEGETRTLIPSPKIKTYDLKPEMSAYELTDELLKALKTKAFDVIICNFANPDMVGHTGNFPATILAIECLDACLGKIWEEVQRQNGHLLITADHGNAECNFDPAHHQPHTAHTSNLVPLLLLGDGWTFNASCGSLVDIAPTILTLIGVTPPSEMTGQILVSKK